eukprot:CAMPEP_0198333874 /NCGR_PEP_ID=MMETSP1450-20131203/19245_1 /TAXON_ID=753684 ORGANISM="Madagascaria erythrocladiodes, Strain CCMP3234" /NCGR_SAMPLE_ID=MMETSP1450 /ASSEMBLY_ACC=CAM_ASM_001115 /LENGTH=95 /DNA_ID=CAMNT_0044038423 /DNA_START=38 /DNA_END=325 /DNA_ORIENTATION=+
MDSTGFVAPVGLGLRSGDKLACVRSGGGAAVVRNGAATLQCAHHVNPKAAKRKVKRRPKKSRPSDINRKEPPYMVAPLREMEGLPDDITVIPKEE